MTTVETGILTLAVAAGSAMVVRLARVAAVKKALFDQPNERSSHRVPVPRLGGASFMPLVLTAAAVGWRGSALPSVVVMAFFGAAAVLYVVSLADDLGSLRATTRLVIQFIAAGGFVAAAMHSAPAAFEFSRWPPGVAGALLTVWMVGMLNIYNFMDGIDGIAGVQAVSAGAGWAAVGAVTGAPATALLGTVVAAGALGFLTLNWSPAKIFMGDAGSTLLGFVFAAAPVLARIEGGYEPGWLGIASALLVWPFLADGFFTIGRRLRRKENIFVAHRSHLYQRLVISGVSHAKVAAVYGVLAVAGAALALTVLRWRTAALPAAALLGCTGFVGLWRWTLHRERQRVNGRDR